MYRLLLESFNNKEFRAVFVPKAQGGRRSVAVSGDESQASQMESGIDSPEVCAPPRAGAGGGDSGSDSEPLVDACDFVKRSHSGLARFSSWGRKARQSLRRAGEAADVLDGNPSHWAFFTLTFPASAPGANAAIAENSGWIVQRVKNLLRPYDRDESAFFYVWERQARGALHLHYCHRVLDGFEVTPHLSRIRDYCCRIVSDLSKRSGVNVWEGRSGIDWSKFPSKLRIDYQLVRKNVGRYLSKYTSKQSQYESEKWAKKESPAPQRWWGCSDSLKELVERLTVVRRRDFSSYMDASNEFASTIDVLRLYKSGGCEYTGDIPGVVGAYFVMMRDVPCQRLPICFRERSRGSMRLLTTAEEVKLMERYSAFDWLDNEAVEDLKFLETRKYWNLLSPGFQQDYQLIQGQTYALSQSGLLADLLSRLAMEGFVSASNPRLKYSIQTHSLVRAKLQRLSHYLLKLSRDIRTGLIEPRPRELEKTEPELVQMSFL